MTKKTHVKKFLRRQRRVAENARVAGDRNFARLAQIALAPGQDAGDRAICARAAASRLAKLCAAPELVASKRVRETSLEEGEIVAKVTSRRRGRDGAERPKHASLRRLVYTPWFCTDCGFANDHARGTCARGARASREFFRHRTARVLEIARLIHTSSLARECEYFHAIRRRARAVSRVGRGLRRGFAVLHAARRGLRNRHRSDLRQRRV